MLEPHRCIHGNKLGTCGECRVREWARKYVPGPPDKPVRWEFVLDLESNRKLKQEGSC